MMINSPRQPHLPTTDRDKEKIKRLDMLLKMQNHPRGCREIAHLMLPGVYAKRDYPSTKISVRGVKKDQRLSRLFYALFVGAIPEDQMIRHTCDNTKCLNPDHLIPGTSQDNATDKKQRGRGKGRCSGESNANSVLTVELITKKVLPLLKKGIAIKEIAKELGVTPPTISYIKNGRTWSEVTGIPAAPVKSRVGHSKRAPYDRSKPFSNNFIAEFMRSVSIEGDATSLDVETPCRVFIGQTSSELKGRINSDGYGQIRWEGKYRLAHTVGFRIATGRWPKSGYEISHACRNKLCVNPEHLDEMTRKEHLSYAAGKGWLSAGHVGNRGNQRLTDDQIRQIKEIYRDEDIADQEVVERLKLPVSAAALAGIRKGRSGTHIVVEDFDPLIRRGRAARGAKSGRAKLGPEQIHEIRRRRSAGEHALALAEEFGVSRRNVDDIVARRTWKHLSEQE